ncbi:MAG: glycosyltransferase [Pseudomonadota bacterium]
MIQTWDPKNISYLDTCIKSIKNLDYPKEQLQVIVTCPLHHRVNYEDVLSVTPAKEYDSSVEGANFGSQYVDKDAKYIWFLNDDTVVTKSSLKNMIEVAEQTGQIIHPISPCDNQSSYLLHFQIQAKDGTAKPIQKRFHRFHELESDLDNMMNSQSVYPPGLIPQPYLCMFATLVPKAIWDDVGEFDQTFETGQDDIDYSLRAKQKGYQMFVALNALVWHFGGATADTSTNLEKRKKNIAYFLKKWGMYPPGMSAESVARLDESYIQPGPPNQSY